MRDYSRGMLVAVLLAALCLPRDVGKFDSLAANLRATRHQIAGA